MRAVIKEVLSLVKVLWATWLHFLKPFFKESCEWGGNCTVSLYELPVEIH